MPSVTCFGYLIAMACYGDAESERWRLELIDYLRGNLELVRNFSDEAEKYGVRLSQPVDATYLAWMDARELAARTGEKPGHWLLKHAGDETDLESYFYSYSHVNKAVSHMHMYYIVCCSLFPFLLLYFIRSQSWLYMPHLNQ